MPVNPLAVESWRERKLRNSDKAKRFSDRAINMKLEKLQPPKFTYEPYKHQKICFLLGAKHKRYVFLLDMGLGKTKVSLDLFQYWQGCEQVSRGLIMVPYTSNTTTWEDEISKHSPGLECIILHDKMNRNDRIDAINSDADIVVITYAGWNALVAKKQRGKMRVDPDVAADFEAQFDYVIFDESTALKNHKSLTYETCNRLSKQAEIVYALTGTPFNRNPHDLWAQFHATDRGETLGPTLGLFRESFFTKTRNPFSGWYDFTFKKSLEKELHRTLRHGSIRFSEDECLDLPAKVGGIDSPMIRSCTMSKEAYPFYHGLLGELREAQGNYSLMENAYTRMRMVASGFVGGTLDDGDKVEVIFKQNPKLDALEALLEELGEHKAVIFHYFNKTGELICDRLKALKIKHSWLYGKTRDKAGALRKFLTEPSRRLLVASTAGAFGLNLQEAANHMIFYETSDTVITRRQAEKRIHRSGQTKTCYYYDLVMNGSLDSRLLHSLREGSNFFDRIVDGTGETMNDLLTS